MSYGFDLGRLKSSSTGMSYIDRIDYGGGNFSQEYTSPAFEFATGVKAFVTPGENVPATKVPTFPTVTTTLDKANKKITVAATGGNVRCNILVFVR